MKTFRKLSAHFKYDEVVDLNTATSAVQMVISVDQKVQKIFEHTMVCSAIDRDLL